MFRLPHLLTVPEASESIARIAEWDAPTPQVFRDDIAALERPAVLRSIAKDWPLVGESSRGEEAAMAKLAAAANGRMTKVLRAEPELEGRFHYGSDGVSMNFERGEGNIPGVIGGLRELLNVDRPFAMAAQSMLADDFVPSFTSEHPMPWVPTKAKPRLWIGNAAKVATHNDPFENLAVVAAGHRRFTLFPPAAEPDLYLGPYHPTPAGPRISMVHVTAPDFDRFPRFRAALNVAQVADLDPGDAIYIPTNWFHHVEALDRFNVLVNYWWSRGEI